MDAADETFATCDYKLIEETTPSGKSLFECARCEHRSPGPTMKRCGKCPTCGYHWGTLGHSLNCTAMSPATADDPTLRSLAELVGYSEGTPVEVFLPSDDAGLPVEVVIDGMIQCGECRHWRRAGGACGSVICLSSEFVDLGRLGEVKGKLEL